MKLIDLLVKELPKRGGWPHNALSITQDDDGSLCVWDTIDPHYDGFSWKHHTGNSLVCYWHGEGAMPLSFDYKESIATYWQYKEALAASKSVVGRDGWIQWAGGECPVDSDAIVEVKYRKPNQYQFNNDRAGDFAWSHDGFDGDIITYRLQQPGIDTRTNDDRLEHDLNECIGQDFDMPEWNGEGVPPIRCACEMQDSKGAWLPVEIIAKNDGFTFGWSYDYRIVLFVDKADEFRPLRTEAEKSREAACHEIASMIGRGTFFEDAERIYDAFISGKIPGVKLEVK